MGHEIHKRSLLRILSVWIAIAILLSGCSGKTDSKEAAARTAAYEIKTVPRPDYGVLGGEWTVFALYRLGTELPEGYGEIYEANLRRAVKTNKGILSEDKYTEYSRVCLALAAMGKSTRVEGVDLLEKLYDFDKVTAQGINGAIYALLALDANQKEVPVKEQYLKFILEQQGTDGGFSMSGKDSPGEADVTAMALQCMAPYRKQPEINSAIEKGIQLLVQLQDEKGGYESYGSESSETVSQVIIALCTLGIDCNGEAFTRDGKGLYDILMEFSKKDGGFSHTKEEKADMMATDQALCALTAYQRWKDGKNTLFDMSDVE